MVISLRRTISRERIFSCSTEICSMFGGKRVSPSEARTKSTEDWSMDPITPSASFHFGKRALELAKQVFSYGKRVAALEARVEALEQSLGKQLADACNKCGERAMRVSWTSDIMGDGKGQWRKDAWTCEKCGHSEERIIRF
jgi:hypothetical protein